MIVFIDNYDSFTYNLVDYFGQLTSDLHVFRNDAISPEELQRLRPEGIVISPGPGTPDEAGISLQVIAQLGKTVPILGICLGHQAIGQVFGAKVVRAPYPVHGKTSAILHEGDALFKEIPSPFTATRYHSLILDAYTMPSTLKVIARTEDQIVMAIRHQTWPVVGVQFHPESILTQPGLKILKNWFLSVQHKRAMS